MTFSMSMKEARNDFVRVVSETVTRLMHEHGYSRDRATTLLLREIAATNDQDTSEGSKLTLLKQRYHLAQQQASRALVVASAFETLVQKCQNNRVDAIQQLTERIARATFADIPDATTTDNETPPRKTVSEISLPEISHTKQQPSAISTSASTRHTITNNNTQSPSKRTKSSSFSKSTKGKTRKRPIEEMGSASSSSTSNSSPEDDAPTSRARADSVAEAVSAKMNQPSNPESSNSNSSNVLGNKATRAKRSRSMEEEPTSVNSNKRTRTLDA